MTVLECLIENDGFATQDTLIDAIWGDDPDGGPLCVEDILRQHICCLRKKLQPGWGVIDVFNHGYKLVYGIEDSTTDSVDARVDDANDLHFAGNKYHLTPSQSIIMRMLLSGRPVSVPEIEFALWPNDADLDAHSNPEKTVHVHIHQIRKAQPLPIRNIPGVGYVLETPMSDEKPRPPEVDQAANRIQKSFGKSGREGDFSDIGIVTGEKSFDGDAAKVKAKGKGIDVEIIIKPEKT